nr:helix-turn-helix transcriptional regulator [uncultured Niameybacter sp.]
MLLHLRFAKAVGVSFSNYLTELRMTKAKALMDQTHMKIYEVSEHVGYKNVEHFNRVFKKTIGVSPTQYRKS